jgi:hypothetical protein
MAGGTLVQELEPVLVAGHHERRQVAESSANVRLDGDRMTADPTTVTPVMRPGTYIWTRTNLRELASFESRTGRAETSHNCEVQPSAGCDIPPPTEPVHGGQG